MAKVLRVGVVRGGRLEAERIVGPGGRLSLDGVVFVQRSGEYFVERNGQRVAVCDGERGRIVVGDAVVLYQLATTAPRPQLPAALRHDVLRSLDWMLVTIIAMSFVGHFGFVLYLRTLDWPRADTAAMPDTFVRAYRPTPPPAMTHLETPAEKPAPSEIPRPAPQRPARPARPRPSATDARNAVLGILTGRGGAPTARDILKHGDVAGEAEQIFGSVGGVSLPTGGPVAMRDGGERHVVAGRGLQAVGPDDVLSGSRGGEHPVLPTPRPDDVIPKDGPIDPSIIAGELRRRLRAVTACYEASMRHHGRIGGKVVWRFALSPTGAVTSAVIDEDSMRDAETNDCVRARALGWRFPAPSKAVQFSYPFVFVPPGAQ
jgi:hypothetical protein